MKKFELKCRIKINCDSILCLLVLKDSSIALGTNDSSIKLFSPRNYSNYLTIKEHQKGITSLTQSNKLEFNNLISTSKDSTIIIFHLTGNSYKIIIKILNHYKKVNKFMDLKLNDTYNFCSCSDDGILNLYNMDKNGEVYAIKNVSNFNFNDIIYNMIETKINEIAVVLSSNYHCLKFIDTQNKSTKKTIQKISVIGNNSICLYKNEYLVIGGAYMITVINIVNYTKQIIDSNSWKIYSIINISDKDNVISFCDDEGKIFFNEIIINENGLNLKEKYSYINCYSTAIFAMTFDSKYNLLITGGLESDINIFNIM